MESGLHQSVQFPHSSIGEVAEGKNARWGVGGIAQFISRHSRRVRWGTRLPLLPVFGLIKNFLSPNPCVVQDRGDTPTPPKGGLGRQGAWVVMGFKYSQVPGATLHPDPRLPRLV